MGGRGEKQNPGSETDLITNFFKRGWEALQGNPISQDYLGGPKEVKKARKRAEIVGSKLKISRLAPEVKISDEDKQLVDNITASIKQKNNGTLFRQEVAVFQKVFGGNQDGKFGENTYLRYKGSGIQSIFPNFNEIAFYGTQDFPKIEDLDLEEVLEKSKIMLAKLGKLEGFKGNEKKFLQLYLKLFKSLGFTRTKSLQKMVISGTPDGDFGVFTFGEIVKKSGGIDKVEKYIKDTIGEDEIPLPPPRPVEIIVGIDTKINGILGRLNLDENRGRILKIIKVEEDRKLTVEDIKTFFKSKLFIDAMTSNLNTSQTLHEKLESITEEEILGFILKSIGSDETLESKGRIAELAKISFLIGEFNFSSQEISTLRKIINYDGQNIPLLTAAEFKIFLDKYIEKWNDIDIVELKKIVLEKLKEIEIKSERLKTIPLFNILSEGNSAPLNGVEIDDIVDIKEKKDGIIDIYLKDKRKIRFIPQETGYEIIFFSENWQRIKETHFENVQLDSAMRFLLNSIKNRKIDILKITKRQTDLYRFKVFVESVIKERPINTDMIKARKLDIFSTGDLEFVNKVTEHFKNNFLIDKNIAHEEDLVYLNTYENLFFILKKDGTIIWLDKNNFRDDEYIVYQGFSKKIIGLGEDKKIFLKILGLDENEKDTNKIFSTYKKNLFLSKILDFSVIVKSFNFDGSYDSLEFSNKNYFGLSQETLKKIFSKNGVDIQIGELIFFDEEKQEYNIYKKNGEKVKIGIESLIEGAFDSFESNQDSKIIQSELLRILLKVKDSQFVIMKIKKLLQAGNDKYRGVFTIKNGMSYTTSFFGNREKFYFLNATDLFSDISFLEQKNNISKLNLLGKKPVFRNYTDEFRLFNSEQGVLSLIGIDLFSSSHTKPLEIQDNMTLEDVSSQSEYSIKPNVIDVLRFINTKVDSEKVKLLEIYIKKIQEDESIRRSIISELFTVFNTTKGSFQFKSQNIDLIRLLGPHNLFKEKYLIIGDRRFKRDALGEYRGENGETYKSFQPNETYIFIDRLENDFISPSDIFDPNETELIYRKAKLLDYLKSANNMKIEYLLEFITRSKKQNEFRNTLIGNEKDEFDVTPEIMRFKPKDIFGENEKHIAIGKKIFIRQEKGDYKAFDGSIFTFSEGIKVKIVRENEILQYIPSSTLDNKKLGFIPQNTRKTWFSKKFNRYMSGPTCGESAFLFASNLLQKIKGEKDRVGYQSYAFQMFRERRKLYPSFGDVSDDSGINFSSDDIKKLMMEKMGKVAYLYSDQRGEYDENYGHIAVVFLAKDGNYYVGDAWNGGIIELSTYITELKKKNSGYTGEKIKIRGLNIIA